MNNKNNTRILLGAIAALGLSAPSAFAVAYTLAPGGTQDWNTAATWSPSTGTPGGAAGDTATLSGNFTGVNQVVNISTTLANGLTTLTLGDTSVTPGSTTIGTSGGSLSLNAATINSNGTVGAVNTITAPISQTGGITVGAAVANTNNLTISGKITPAGVAASRAIENSGMKTVTLGDIDITSGSTAGVILTVRAGTTAAGTIGSNLILNGTIADGGTVSGAMIFGARSGNLTAGTSSIQFNGNNTYTGATTLGIQANVHTVYKINTDQAFGGNASALLTIGAGSANNILEAVGSDRTITKSTTTINRQISFQGNNSLSFAATTIKMSNGPSGGLSFINNNISASGKTVTLGSVGSNLYFNDTNTTDLYRLRDVAGAGTTIINSSMSDNSGTVDAASRMVLAQAGTGTLVLTGNNTYQGGTRISGTGSVQLGNGGTTGSIAPANGLAAVVNGTAAGTLVLNRTDAYSSALTANGPIGITQKGNGGSVTLSNTQFNSGNNIIGDGTNPSTLIVNGASVAQASTTGATITNSANGQLAINTVTLTAGTTANLKVGQPVYITGNASSVAYVDSITSSTTFKVGGLQASSSVGPLATATGVSLTFGAGSALGTGTTTVNAGSTLGGSGTVAGAVTLNSATIGNSGNTLTLSSSLTTNGSSNVGTGSTVNTSGITVASGTFTVNGTLGGSTVINGGTVVAANNNAFSGSVTINAGGKLSIGTGVTIGNAITLAGGTLALAGGTYAPVLGAASSYSSVIPLTSSFAGGKPDTTASLIGGTTGGSRTVSTSFSDTSTASNDNLRFSDVLSLSGTGGDIFVLQVSVSGVSDNTWIGWLYNGSWVNAVNGNVGSVGSSALSAYAGSFASSGATASADYLGSYGYDSAGGTVWAVIDHNSDFAAIPEPSACAALAGLGILGLAAYRRRRSRA